MKIIFNGTSIDSDSGSTLLQLLHAQNLEPDKVVVELNANIVPSTDFATTLLREDDRLEVLHFVGGG